MLGEGDETSVAIILAVFIGLVVLAAGIRQAGGSHETDRLRFEKKAAAYQRLLDAWALAASKKESLSREDDRRAMEAALHEVTLWGNSEVIRHLRPFSRRTTPLDIHNTQERIALENVLRAMRRDLGQHNLVLQEGDLLNLLVGRGSQTSSQQP